MRAVIASDMSGSARDIRIILRIIIRSIIRR